MFKCLPGQKHFFRISRQSSAYNFIVWKCDNCNKHQYLTKAKFYPTYHSKYEPLALTWKYNIAAFGAGMTVDQMKALFEDNAQQLKTIYNEINLRQDRVEAARHTKKERWYSRLWHWLDANLPM